MFAIEQDQQMSCVRVKMSTMWTIQNSNGGKVSHSLEMNSVFCVEKKTTPGIIHQSQLGLSLQCPCPGWPPCPFQGWPPCPCTKSVFGISLVRSNEQDLNAECLHAEKVKFKQREFFCQSHWLQLQECPQFHSLQKVKDEKFVISHAKNPEPKVKAKERNVF